MMRASRPLWFGVVCCVVLLNFALAGRLQGQTFVSPGHFEPYGGVVPFSRSILTNIDLGEDGRIDLRYTHEKVAISLNYHRLALEPAPGTFFVGTIRTNRSAFGGTRPVYEIGEAPVGMVVDPRANRPTLTSLQRGMGRFRIEDRLNSELVPTLWGTTNSAFFLGVVTTGQDGQHAGWVLFVKTNGIWLLTDLAWNPVPDAPLAVGSKAPDDLTSSIIYSSQYTTLTPSQFSLDRDVTIGRRNWTNRVDGSHGYVIDVRGHDEWRWLVRGEGDTNLLVELPERTSLSAPPPALNGAVWREGRFGFVLYRETVSPEGATNRAGLLAGGNSGYAAFRDGDLGGWLQMTGVQGTVLVARKASAVGAPQLSFGSASVDTAQNLDLNEDGLVDFVRVSSSLINADYTSSSERIVSLQGSALARREGLAGVVVGETSTSVGPGSTFDPSDLVSFGSWRSGFVAAGSVGELTTNSWVGVRFEAADGFHYGWLGYESQGFGVGLSRTMFNPWPGEPIVLGALAPGPLRIERLEATKLRVRWPESDRGVLERKGLENESIWVPVATGGQREHIFDVAGNAAFFRLHRTTQ